MGGRAGRYPAGRAGVRAGLTASTAAASPSSCGGSGSETTVTGTLADGATYLKASPGAEAYLIKNIAFNGRISVPVLTMHTTGDGLVVPENEQAYRSAVDRVGRGSLLRQVFVHRAGHCAFTPAETVTAVRTLEDRLSTGHWHVPGPAAMNQQAAALGPQLNIFSVNGKVKSTAPAVTSYRPARYLRPFNLG